MSNQTSIPSGDAGSDLSKVVAALSDRAAALSVKEVALYEKAFQAASESIRARSVRRRGKGAPPPEVKSTYLGLAATAVPSTGAYIHPFSQVVQGVARDQRVGDELWPKKFSIKYTVAASAGGLFSSADSYNCVRVIVFQWRMDDSAYVPNVGLILKAAPSYINAPYNVDTAHLYKVMYDRTHTVFNTPVYTGSAVNVEAGAFHAFSLERPHALTGFDPISYETNLTTGTNMIYVLAVSDSAFSPNPTLQFSAGLSYVDA